MNDYEVRELYEQVQQMEEKIKALEVIINMPTSEQVQAENNKACCCSGE